MSGEYDDVLKTLVNARQEDFARWVVSFVGEHEVGAVKPLKTEFNRHIMADALSQVLVDGDDLVFHYEFQTKNEKNVPMRGLEYHYQALREYDLPVWTFVIYLKKRGTLPSPPWQSKPWQGRVPITFDYTVIDLSTMTAEELRETGLPGIMPLMILTRDGATREVAEEIMTDLELLSDEISMVAYTLIALTFGKRKDDREWLRRRWKNMSNRLMDNWFIQEITEDARKETEKRVREEERRKLEEEQRKREEEQRKREEEQRKREEERKQELERLRQLLLSFVQARFPEQKMERQARGQAAIIDDPKILQDLILKIGLAQTAEEAEDYLLSYPESA